ncbi:hypothetical protein HOLleu_05377 [Holothuria leucospilota]|uniref:Uncharacterized protein n=1 Tax=Holothuria leucospilota TaxID=206669 RepID=A0A9Q1HJ01_HOLLE|nr:hypothetical protein HOLleu_05377 [Holothuria leucospilota]
MAMCLAASLRGEAQAFLADLNIHARREYLSLVNALSRRCDPAHQTSVFRIQLKNLIRRKEESLPELAQEIRRLTRQVYPCAPSELQMYVWRCTKHDPNLGRSSQGITGDGVLSKN